MEKGFTGAQVAMIAAAAALLVGGGVAAYFIFTSDEPAKPALTASGTQAAK